MFVSVSLMSMSSYTKCSKKSIYFFLETKKNVLCIRVPYIHVLLYKIYEEKYIFFVRTKKKRALYSRSLYKMYRENHILCWDQDKCPLYPCPTCPCPLIQNVPRKIHIFVGTKKNVLCIRRPYVHVLLYKMHHPFGLVLAVRMTYTLCTDGPCAIIRNSAHYRPSARLCPSFCLPATYNLCNPGFSS